MTSIGSPVFSAKYIVSVPDLPALGYPSGAPESAVRSFTCEGLRRGNLRVRRRRKAFWGIQEVATARTARGGFGCEPRSQHGPDRYGARRGKTAAGSRRAPHRPPATSLRPLVGYGLNDGRHCAVSSTSGSSRHLKLREFLGHCSERLTVAWEIRLAGCRALSGLKTGSAHCARSMDLRA